MRFLLGSFMRRIAREGFKSLSVPVLAFVFILIIGIMSATAENQEERLEEIVDTFEVRIEVSNTYGSIGGLTREYIDEEHIRLFTDSVLSEYVTDINLRYQSGNIIGITSMQSDERLDPTVGSYIEWREGYDEGIFRTADPVCVVSFDTGEYEYYELEGWFDFSVGEMVFFEEELEIAGRVYGAGDVMFVPFWMLCDLSGNVMSDTLTATIADNRRIEEFAASARSFFVAAGTVDESIPYSLTIYNGEYNTTIEELTQNILLINIVTPFIYAISVLVGFIAGYILIRRRKPEFAVMRSIGVRRGGLVTAILCEQAILCLGGAVVGCIVFFLIWGHIVILQSVLFIICYLLGAGIVTLRSTGQDILKLLHDKE